MNTILRTIWSIPLIGFLGTAVNACTSTSPSDSPASPTPTVTSSATPTTEPYPNRGSERPTSDGKGYTEGKPETYKHPTDGPTPNVTPYPAKRSSLPTADWFRHLAGLEKTKPLFAQAIFPKAIGYERSTLVFVPLKNHRV